MTNNATIQWKHVSVDNAENIDNVRLVASTDNEPSIFYSNIAAADPTSYITTIKKLDFNGTKPTDSVFTYKQILPVSSQWDVTFDHVDSYHCVIQIAGGAINRLMFLDKKNQIQPLTLDYDFESFSEPRFFKYALPETTPGMSTVVDSEELVLFAQKSDPKLMQYTKVGPWSKGILTRTKTGYFLFAKRQTISPEQMGGIPGSLEVIELDPLLQIKNPPQKIAIGQDIYEFDVDILPSTGSEKFALLVTGKENVTFAITDNHGSIRKSVVLSNQHPETSFFTRPAVFAQKDSVYVAAIENIGQPNARLLKTTIPLAPDS